MLEHNLKSKSTDIFPSYLCAKSVGRSAFDFVYKVPDSEEYNDIAGGRILMQWFYVTANSCFSPGYKGTAIGDYLNSQGWLRSGGNLSLCNLPFDQTGQSSPERVRSKKCTLRRRLMPYQYQYILNAIL